MKILSILRRIFKTQESSEQAHDIKNEITRESLKTTVSVSKANKVLHRNTTITHNIARALGVI